jgi:GTPase Era involved in 16S rRNA processing
VSAKTDLKVALIGHVSVGKKTVLNALFRDKFGEVSMKRTTAGINYFRLIPTKDKANKKPKMEENADEPTEDNGKQWVDIASYDTKSAGTIFKEITADNKTFRNSSSVYEKPFDIELDEPLCDIREDADLVVVDVPGINEAGAGSKYRDFVEKKWDTFDVVVLVMDGRQGVNTEEQLKLLQFVKTNQEKKRRVSLIILLNKVDDPDDEEQSVLVDEYRKEAEKQFNCRLESFLNTTQQNARSKTRKFTPILIPTSAMHAYFYRTASMMTFDQCKRFDKDLIEKVGREEVGKFKWKRTLINSSGL